MGSSPDTPQEDPQIKLLRRRQAEQLVQLDDEQNARLKRLISSSNGLRIFRGAPQGRLPGMNSTRSAAPDNYGLTQSRARGYDWKQKRAQKTYNTLRGIGGQGPGPIVVRPPASEPR